VTKKLLFAMIACLLVLGGGEVAARIVAWRSGLDLTVDPLPLPPDTRILCPLGSSLVQLCPEEVQGYERVRPEVFFEAPDQPRVIVIGESFVHGYTLPEEEAWPARLGVALGGDMEVLNFGRCGSYASRLVPVVNAALTLHPRVLVLAIGNNEHTMTSFYTGWAGRHPLGMYRTSEILGGSRLFGGLYRMVGGEPRIRETMERPPLRDEVDRLIFAARRRPPDLSVFTDLLASRDVTRALENEQRLKERVFRGVLDRMVRTAQDAGVRVILCTLPRDLTFPPNLSGVHRGDEEKIRGILRKLGDGMSMEALAAADEGIRVDDRVARFRFVRGVRNLVGGDREKAIADLRASVEWDMAPDATPSINAIIREVARSRDVDLVDLDAISTDWLSARGAYLKDPVHLTALGADEVGRTVAAAITEDAP